MSTWSRHVSHDDSRVSTSLVTAYEPLIRPSALGSGRSADDPVAAGEGVAGEDTIEGGDSARGDVLPLTEARDVIVEREDTLRLVAGAGEPQ